MLGNFTSNATVAATNDQDLLWVWMNVQRDERDHLLVRELVELGALDAVVENENVSKGFAKSKE